MSFAHQARLLSSLAVLTLGGPGLPLSATGQSVYEPFAFVGFSGPRESPGWHDGAGALARFFYPFSVAVDAGGALYVADASNHTIRKVAPGGAVMTVAGMAGQSGSADGTGAAARFNTPTGIAVDGDGIVYVADCWNHTIRKIGPGGAVTTLAGSAGISGQADGPGSEGRFYFPYGVAVDGSGAVLVADTYNHAVRKVTPEGQVTTVAGLAGTAGSADGTGAAARFQGPTGVTVDPAGTLFVADYGNNTIRKITTNGVVTTWAGTAGRTGTANGTGSSARFNQPSGVAADRAGNLFVADSTNHTIRKITSARAVTTWAGTATQAGDVDGTGGAARFTRPMGLAVGSDGTVYVADYGNHTIRQATPSAAVSTLAGSGGGLGATDGSGAVARFNFPAALAVDAAGNTYVADLANHTIRKIAADGTVSTWAGLAGTSGTANGTGGSARFNTPTGIAADTNGNVYVADTYNHTIRKISPTRAVTTFAGSAGKTGTADGTGGNARFSYPFNLTVAPDSNLYVADTYNHTIRKITPAGLVSTVAGVAGTSGSADGTSNAATFSLPHGLAADRHGTVYVADSGNNVIRRLSSDGSVTTLAGTAGSTGSSDGLGPVARFSLPNGLALDEAGNLYVAELGNHTIRKVTPAGLVTTLGGDPGRWGSANGAGAGARFNNPEGLALDRAGVLYVTDASNHTIRKGYPALPDLPWVDRPVAPPGVIRQLNVTNLTVSAWSWSIIRHPAASATQLSSATAQNPTLMPDVTDEFVIRFEGTNSLGQLAIATLGVTGSDPTPPQIDSISLLGSDLVLRGSGGRPSGGFTLLDTPVLTLPATNWHELAAGHFDGTGSFAITNDVDASARFYLIRVP